MWTNHVTLQGVKSYYGRGSQRRAGVNTQPQPRDSSRGKKKSLNFFAFSAKIWNHFHPNRIFFCGGEGPSWIFHRVLMIPLTGDGEDGYKKEKKKSTTIRVDDEKPSFDWWSMFRNNKKQTNPKTATLHSKVLSCKIQSYCWIKRYKVAMGRQHLKVNRYTTKRWDFSKLFITLTAGVQGKKTNKKTNKKSTMLDWIAA